MGGHSAARWRLATVGALLGARSPLAQGPPVPESQLPVGLRQWIGLDFCGQDRWIAFHGGLAEVVKEFNNREFEPALLRLAELLAPVVRSTEAAFSCATAVASALALAAQSCDQLQRPVLAARFRQLSAIFGSYDYQMKGEDYINDSPWPINWKQNMEGILRSMAFLKQHEVQAEPWRNLAARAAAPRGAPKRRVAIVTVCDYDPTQTPLARLSKLNRDAYAKMHGYDVVMYEKAPLFADPLAELLTEPLAHRPPAWSKVDALLETLAQGRHDWVMWLDCDSFFMDPEVRLEEVITLAESRCPAAPGDDAAQLRELVAKWQTGPEQEPESLLDWYDSLLESHAVKGAACNAFEPPTTAPSNRTLGWSEWLFQETRPQLVASEDGLMLNTGVMLARASVWSWAFFQKVRWMTFGRSPVTQHPWWEQTAMVYLLQFPFVLAQALVPGARDLAVSGPAPGFAAAWAPVAQKTINGYPPLVSSALLTHSTFEPGDFIVSFSGCKIYSSQEVCNQLFLNYFFQVHSLDELAEDPALRPWL